MPPMMASSIRSKEDADFDFVVGEFELRVKSKIGWYVVACRAVVVVLVVLS